MNSALKSISGIKESAWTPIKYPDAIWDENKARLIVKYREDNGNFKTIDDLLKVPGVNMRAVESKRAQIDF